MAAMDVLLVDDQPGRASSLRILTNRAFGDVRMRTACSLAAGLQKARETKELDLVVLELNVSGACGIDALLAFRQEFPSLRVLVICGDEHSSRSTPALEAGAVGYVPKTVSLLATAAAIRLIAEGGTYVPTSEFLPRVRQADNSEVGLTAREIEVLRLLARGFDSGQIARELNVAEDIVELQVLGILLALGASSRVEALIIAARRGVTLD
jgi:DNA-binding NarL/FixJ family response regulator